MYDALDSILPQSATEVDGLLHIAGVGARDLADAYGTPLIAYDAEHVRSAARAWTDAFAGYERDVLIAYATKAFSSVGLLRLLGELGIGADVASEGELLVATKAGIPGKRLVIHGNNKSRVQLEAAVAANAAYVVLDAPSELELLEDVVRASGSTRRQPVLVRVNPDIEVETHRYIRTAHAGSKFGVPGSSAADLLVRARASEWLDPRGVHVHLGSQLLDADPWHAVLEWLATWAVALHAEHDFVIDTLDIGGGLGIAYLRDQEPPAPREIAERVLHTLRTTWQDAGLALPSLVVEPGRSIVGQAAVTLYTVGVVKETDGGIRYVNVDGGMSDNPRPVLYQAEYEAVLAERMNDAADGTWWVAGMHCESGDVLVEDAALPRPRTGELLAIPATGAYAASMASTYNMHPRCAVVLVDRGNHRPLLHRESVQDLLARDADA